MTAPRPLVIVVCGPTAVGKTALAVALAERFGGEILGADSRQVYRRMDVGTAKPTHDERARVPHHLVDVVDPEQDFDAGSFRRLAERALADIAARGRVALIVGGSGFYVRALTTGLPELPSPDPEVRAAVRAELAAHGAPWLHAKLASVDAPSAARLHPNDAVRVARAVEVHRQTGRPLSSFGTATPIASRVVRVLVDRGRAELDARIEARARAMWRGGFLEEVAALREAGIPPSAKALSALGYREVWEHLSRGGGASGARAEATLAAIVLATRQFTRRQRAWFRPAEDERILHPESDWDAIVGILEAALAPPDPRRAEDVA